MSTEQSSPTEVPAPSQVFRFLWPGAMASQAIHVAAKLGIADVLKAGPLSVDELAAATGSHAASLLRLLRALKSIGIFTEEKPGVFRNTTLSDCLQRDHPQSVHAWAIFLSSPFLWTAFGQLHETVMTGEPAVLRH